MPHSDLGPALLGKATIDYPQKKRPRIVSAWGMKTVRLRFPLGINILKRGHGETRLGSLVVAIAALGSYIVTTTNLPLPGPTRPGTGAPPSSAAQKTLTHYFYTEELSSCAFST